MPGGNVHSTATIALAAAVGVASYYQGWPVLPVVAGVITELIINPDLDVNQGNISHKFIRRSLGCLLGGLWSIYWWPYSRLIPHRHWLSHLPVISTAVRILYAFWWLLLLAWAGFAPVPTWWYWPVAGLAAADTVHWLLDQLFRN